MIVVINGAPCSGKDLFCDLVADVMGNLYSHSISSVDYVKQAARTIGWNGEKDLKGRALLSGLKSLLTNYNDAPMQNTLHQVRSLIEGYEEYGIPSNSYVIFVHIREPEEIQRFLESQTAVTLFLSRKIAEIAPKSNSSDRNVLNFKYDFIIENNSSINDLKQKVIKFLEENQINYKKRGI